MSTRGKTRITRDRSKKLYPDVSHLKDENEDKDYRAAYLQAGGTKFKGPIQVPHNPFEDDPITEHVAHEDFKHWSRGRGTEDPGEAVQGPVAFVHHGRHRA